MNQENFSYGAIEPAIKAIRENYASIRELKGKCHDTGEDVFQLYLMDALGYTQAQANEVIHDLKEGLKSYDSNRMAVEQDPQAIENGIVKELSGYSEDERKVILVNILTAFQMMDDCNKEKDLAELRDVNSLLSESKLVEGIVNSLDGLPFRSVIETVNTELDPNILASLTEMREMRENEYKLAAALMLYVAQQQHQLDLGNNGIPLSANTIGAMTGASIEAINATSDLHDGRIDLAKWQRILKYILGALLLTVLCALSAVAILTVGMGIYSVIMSIFGTGILATVIGSIVLFGFCFKACDLQSSVSDWVMDKMSNIYDKAIVRLTAIAKSLYSKIKDFLGSKISKSDTLTTSKDEQKSGMDLTTGEMEGNTINPIMA